MDETELEFDENGELLPLAVQPPEQEEQYVADQLERERQSALRVLTPQQQQPLGAQAYDQAARALAAGRVAGLVWQGAMGTKPSYPPLSSLPPPQPTSSPPATFDETDENPPLAALVARQRGAEQPAAPSLTEMSTRYNGQPQPEVQLPAPGAPPVAPAEPAPFGYEQYQQMLAEMRARQEASINSAYERSRPSDSEKWLAIAAALASPTQHGSFGETMGNVFQALLGYKQGVRGAENERQKELARLGQAYDLQGLRGAVSLMKPKTAATLAFDSLGQGRDKGTGAVVSDASGRRIVRNADDFAMVKIGEEYVSGNTGKIHRRAQ